MEKTTKNCTNAYKEHLFNLEKLENVINFNFMTNIFLKNNYEKSSIRKY